jgi:hypothetical protein
MPETEPDNGILTRLQSPEVQDMLRDWKILALGDLRILTDRARNAQITSKESERRTMSSTLRLSHEQAATSAVDSVNRVARILELITALSDEARHYQTGMVPPR